MRDPIFAVLLSIVTLIRKAQNYFVISMGHLYVQCPVGLALSIVFGVVLAAIGGSYAIIQLRVFGVIIAVFVIFVILMTIRAGGFLDNLQNMRRVRMHQVILTLAPDELKKVQESEWAALVLFRGETLNTFIETNKKLARSWGPGSLVRASPTRAVPVIADLEHPGTKFWALENNGIVRWGQQGYVDVKIRLTDPRSVNPHVGDALHRWQQLRLRAARGDGRRVAYKLRSLTVSFIYPSYQYDGVLKMLEVRFHQELARLPRGRNGRVPKPQEDLSIEELEEQFEVWLEEARQAEANKKRKAKPAVQEEAATRHQSQVLSEEASPAEAAAVSHQISANKHETSKNCIDQKCKAGHELKAYRKRGAAVCDICEAKIPKGEWSMACVHYPICWWYACARCVPLPVPTEDECSLCVCCLEESATMVMKGCGHLIYCAKCGRSFVALALGITVKSKALKQRQIENTRVPCPVCRQESCMAEKHMYTGTLYTA